MAKSFKDRSPGAKATMLLACLVIADTFLFLFTGCHHESLSSVRSSEVLAIKVSRFLNSGPPDKPTLQLDQPWNFSQDADFRPGTVQIGWSAESFIVEADLVDDEIITRATEDNQPLWTLGDVFEIFLQIEGRSDYVELHIAPNNLRMHLHKPNAAGKVSAESPVLSIAEMLVSPPGFSSNVTYSSHGWRIKATIPASVLGLHSYTSGTEMRASLCRYDAGRDREPVLSKTSAHPIASFHRPHEWKRLVLLD